MAVNLKRPSEIKALHKAGNLVADTFSLLKTHVKPGVSLLELDAIAADYIRANGGRSAYLDYETSTSSIPFPANICTSLNDEVCHGIPRAKKLVEGDTVGVDIGLYLDGWVGDACITFPVGKVSNKAHQLLSTAYECLWAGLAEVKPGNRLGDIGAAIQHVAESQNYSVVREMVGHGVGKSLHEGPSVNHFGKRNTGMRLREGMVFTIEPMINMGGREIRLLPDEWTIATLDGSLSAQYEHVIAVTSDSYEILTPWEYSLSREGTEGTRPFGVSF